MFPGHPEHLESFDYLGLYRHSLRFSTAARADHFVAPAHVEMVFEQIVRAASDERFAIVAYCFMPDHVHLLVEGLTDGSDCLAFIRRAKQFSGFYFKKAHGQRLWQRYGFERVLRNDESMLSVARYILENPVRAGLVARVEDYPFVGSQTHPLSEILEVIQLMPVTRKTR
jgi:putative transposase